MIRQYSNMRQLAARWFALPALLGALAGCAGTPPTNQITGDDNASKLSRDAEPTATTSDTIAARRNYPVRPFPAQTFYQLLVAEFAGIRGDLNQALEIYAKQAQITRDPHVVERAARTASHLNNLGALERLSALWVAVDPDSTEARKLSFYYQSRQGDVLGAFDHARFLFVQGDGEPLVMLPAFTENLDTESRLAMLEQYAELERTHPDDRSILLGRIQLEGQQGDLKQALRTGKKLLQLEPHNENARLAIAQLLYKHNDRDEAMATLVEGIKHSPDNKQLHLQLIRFVAETDLNDAQRRLTQLASDHAEDLNLQYSLALINKQLNLRAEAEAIFRRLIARNWRVGDAHFQLAIMAQEDDLTEQAISHFMMVGAGKNLLPAVASIAQLMSGAGDLNAARIYLHRQRLEHPKHAVAFYRMESELLMNLERYQSAHSLLSESLEQLPDNVDLLYTRSLVSEKLNDIVSMERDLRTIIASDANNASALNALGYSLANHTNRYEEALALVNKALSIKPRDAAIIDSLGWILYRLGKHEAALVRLREAMTVLPDPEIAAHLGEVLWVTGEREEALRVWRSALEQDPESRYLRDTLTRFEVEL